MRPENGERRGWWKSSAAADGEQQLDAVGILLLLPATLLLVVMFIGPVGFAFYLGVTNIALVGPTAQHFHFTGLKNLHRLVNDRLFWESLKLTAIFLGASAVVGVTIIGMALAVLMQHAVTWLRTVVGAIVVVAWMLPPITAALLWYAFSTTGGTLSLLSGSDSDILNDFPMTIVCLANIWSTAGFSMLVLSSGLRTVPAEVLEAGKMEGASRWQVFRTLTLPIMRPTIVTNVLLVTLLSLANFSLIYIMTAGGPGNATNILPIYSYQQAFQFNKLAYGALLGDVVVIIATVFAYLYVRVSRPPRAGHRPQGKLA
jgi:multiple sugar transport system permease protein